MTWAIPFWTALTAAVFGAPAALAPVASASGTRALAHNRQLLAQGARQHGSAGAHSAQAPAGSGSLALSWNSVLGEFTGTYTSSFSYCDDVGYCGWFPYAWEQPSSAPSCDAAWDSSVIYVHSGVLEGP